MKRFMIFGYDKYYPNGGMDDFLKDFDTLELAKAHIADKLQNGESDLYGLHYDYYDVYDLELKLIIHKESVYDEDDED